MHEKPDPEERTDSYERMPFLKLYSREWLNGSLRVENDAAERGVWADFLALANESRNRGMIQANEDTPYPHAYLAATLNISVELLEQCLLRFTEQGRIVENEHGILLTSFSYWQGLDTRRRGRPSKKGREPTEEEKLESEYRNKLAVARMDKQKELGRSVTNEELNKLIKKVKRQVYGK